MCEEEYFLSSQRSFHIPKGGSESRPASAFFFLPIWQELTIHDYSCLCAGRACLSWLERILTCVKNLSTCGDRLYERNCYKKSYKWLDGQDTYLHLILGRRYIIRTRSYGRVAWSICQSLFGRMQKNLYVWRCISAAKKPLLPYHQLDVKAWLRALSMVSRFRNQETVWIVLGE